MPDRATVAVVGLGAAGLATMKNLAEEGFEVTGFERSSSIGGVWSFEETPNKTTVMRSTVANRSKYKFCFTDFPYSSDTPVYPLAADVHQYLQDYASHFDLHRSIETNTIVEKITRNEDSNCWELRLRYSKTKRTEPTVRQFDRVVLATGIGALPVTPEIKGIEKFSGTVIHSQQFKNPDDFVGKNVMVVGLNNSAGDTATSLVGVADKIYLSHRRGAIFLKRWLKNKPLDADTSWVQMQMMQKYLAMIPSLTNWFLIKIQNQFHTLRPEWRLNENMAPFAQSLPLMNEDIVDAMHEGKIISVSNLIEVVDERTVLLQDGTTVTNLDAIIFCTGYKPDFSILGDYEPEFRNLYQDGTKPLPKLYQNIFSLDSPDSLAWVCGVGFQMAVFHVYDLASMALAQVWKDAVELPPAETMRAQVDRHYKWITSLAENGSVYPDSVQPEWYCWADETAGANVYRHLGYGMDGWRFWLNNRVFCNKLMYSIFSPHTWRLFDGRRKKWDGAREEVLKVVKEVQEMR
ncbi:flavin monooxygenase-like protein [Aspergillus karnatakaensis]|uniref:flavin-containing monooxygenase n=1 Tax=Aspergillus karnatakaensis TaxID=1810916 RepID=UPI003CCDFF08